MKLLLTAVSVLACACGPAEEPAEVASSSSSSALTEEIPQPGEPQPSTHLEVVSTKLGLIFKLVQDPVEDRFFMKIDVTQPAPTLPLPACPACR
jgi:hypothetical protein